MTLVHVVAARSLRSVMGSKIKIIEEYVASLPHDLKPSHGPDHVSRVRNWALKIAEHENFQNIELIEATALLHDVGRSVLQTPGKSHGELGAAEAKKFLIGRELFSPAEIDLICEAVENHCNIKPINNQLLDILRDADILDLMGAIGILRGVAAENDKSTFDPNCAKGETWEKSNDDFTHIFKGKFGSWKSLPDQINFQLSCYENLKSEYARSVAKPMQEFMKNFILEVEQEAKLNKE